MPGSGSALDRNDHEVLRRLCRALEANARELERLNDREEGGDA